MKNDQCLRMGWGKIEGDKEDVSFHPYPLKGRVLHRLMERLTGEGPNDPTFLTLDKSHLCVSFCKSRMVVGGKIENCS